MTTATARSNTLPFIINCLNSAAIDIKSTIHIRRQIIGYFCFSYRIFNFYWFFCL
jgi:hypothetical protein